MWRSYAKAAVFCERLSGQAVSEILLYSLLLCPSPHAALLLLPQEDYSHNQQYHEQYGRHQQIDCCSWHNVRLVC